MNYHTVDRARWLLSGITGAVATFVAIGFAADDTPAEKRPIHLWRDVTGTYKVEADFVSLQNGNVNLRKTDGVIISVPLAKFCAEDVDFAKSQATALRSKIRTAGDLEKKAKTRRTAQESLKLYEEFLVDPDVDASEKEFAKNSLPRWQQAAQQDLLRIGLKWVTTAEAESLRKQQVDTMVTAQEAFASGDVAGAEKKYSAATAFNPENIAPDYQFGLLLALLARDPGRATACFERCQSRQVPRLADLSPAEKTNFVGVLNNLAIINVRQRKVSVALGFWERALALQSTPEIVQNLGRLAYLTSPAGKSVYGGKASLSLTKAENDQLSALQTKAQTDNDRVFQSGTGWLYMQFVESADIPLGRDPIPAFVERRFGLENTPTYRVFGGTKGQSRRSPYEDPWCLACRGTGAMDCPSCENGSNRSYRTETVTFPNGHQVTTEKAIRVPCTKCDARGIIKCVYCKDGLDPVIFKKATFN